MKKMILIILALYPNLFYAQTYNPQAAADYAKEWCNERNTDNWNKSPNNFHITFGTPYNNYPLDCANFVSQCLIAGGLDLSAGNPDADPSIFVNNGVDNNECIPNAANLLAHLKNRQDTEDNCSSSIHDVGDPMLLVDASGHATHAMFCSGIVGENKRNYCAHTNDRCDEEVTLGNSTYLFHIKSSTPAHCTNCVPDGDETGVDCGGSCPPCQHAKNAVNYNYNTSFLPSETRAFETITAGNADVRVTPGQDVTFITAGNIILKPGFHAQAGSNFKALKSKTRKAVGADCEEFCEPHRNVVCLDVPPNNNNYGWDLVNASSVSITIYQSRTNSNMYAIYSKTIIVGTDGYHELWDLTTGVNTSSFCIQNVFWYRASITTCKGEEIPKSGSITLKNCLKSLSSDSIDITIQEPIIQDDVSLNNEYAIHPNPNTGSFTIQTNNFDNIKQIQVINPLGQTIYTVQHPTNNNITLPNGAKGTYFVRITTETESVTRKILVE